MYILDPVSIGYNSIDIIPDGNIINGIGRVARFERGLLPSVLLLICYTTRGYENPVWKVSDDSSLELDMLEISSHTSAVRINFTDNLMGKVVCQAGNSNSSVIIINSKSLSIVIDSRGQSHQHLLTCKFQYPKICDINSKPFAFVKWA